MTKGGSKVEFVIMPRITNSMVKIHWVERIIFLIGAGHTTLKFGQLRRMRRPWPQTYMHARSKRKGVEVKINFVRRRNCPRVEIPPIYLPGYEAS